MVESRGVFQTVTTWRRLVVVVALLGCLAPTTALAAVAFDASITTGNSADGLNQQASSASSISSTGITVGGSATLLVVVAYFQSGSSTISSLAGTWNGTALTVAKQQNGGTGPGTSAILYLVSPASGANTLQLTWTTVADVYMSAVSFTGSDTTTPLVTADTVGGNSGTTVTVTSDTSGATVASWGINGSTPTVNFTKIYAEAPLAPGAGASYTLGGTSNGHTFTGAGGTTPAWAGVHIQAASGGGGLVCTPTISTLGVGRCG